MSGDGAEDGVGGGKPHYAGHRDRLRQRFLTAGPDALADYELLELLLFSAIPRRDVKPLAKQLIDEFGDFSAVVTTPAEQLAARGGLGPVAVIALKAVQSGAERMLRQQAHARPVLTNWQRLMDYLKVAMQHAAAEQVRLLFLDRKNHLIADEVAHTGTIDHAPVYPREVVKRALDLGASAVILVHNHPSGDPTPSKADIDMTRRVAAALAAIDIALHDHVIVGRKAITSFKAEGLI